MLQRHGSQKEKLEAERRERLRVDRYGTMRDASHYTTERNSSTGRPSTPQAPLNDRWPRPLPEKEERQRQMAEMCVPAPSAREPVTQSFALSGADRNASSTTPSSVESCTTSDFRLVEQELKELLSGYHQLVNTARGYRQSKEENIKASSPLDEAAQKAGDSSVVNKGVSNIAARNNNNGGDVHDSLQVHHSVSSLPVSSVHGERSTDVNTPTPCVHLPQHIISTRNTVGESENAVRIAASYATNPSARVTSPVDLFADALTEDQLSRSLEMQLQREQQMQLLCQHLQPNLLSREVTPNNPNTTIRVFSTPTVDDDTGYLAMRREAGSPVPPFMNRDCVNLDSARDVMTAYRGSYDSRVYAAYRYQDHLGAHGKPSTADVSRSKEITEVGLGDTRNTSCLLGSDQRNEELGGGLHPKDEFTSLDHLLVHSKGKSTKKLQTRRVTSRRRREVVDSTTPEIATSARHTEDPSMRSGATGGNRAQKFGATKKSATFWHASVNMKHTPVEHRRELEVTGDGYGTGGGEKRASTDLSPEAALGGVMVTNGMDRRKQEQKQQQQKEHQQQQKLRSRYRYRHDYKTNENYALNRHANAATRFHEMVERHVAAFEGGSQSSSSLLPAFVDSLVGAAITDFCPAVKRRQARLKESQHAEAAAAAAADASLTRNTYRGSIGTVTPTSSIAHTPNTNVRSSWDSQGHRNPHPNARLYQAVGRDEPALGATCVKQQQVQRCERLSRRAGHAAQYIQ
ncbi:hypothetical protein, conserved [Trypanosoma cruzi]|uniref:Uncharacterized protein n=1 Tax=Trypanosoma cruzi (strain CL Brener) TaxID=353153 RepID=Q4D7V9_TRYCC|nr:hypothetical protein, conserved [Trypanosoma cruzi]EAN88610.1 hypothetical protein, conserved [Trypanosoma cruzi]|eukprot:XP_810461.1 hypothetical protein [Trypanosoma cruzi strain CL Brener]